MREYPIPRARVNTKLSRDERSSELLVVHRQSMGQRVKIKKKYHNQNTKVEIN